MTTFSIGLPNYGAAPPGRGWAGFVDLARGAEAAGFDRIVVVDHLVMGPHTDQYRWGKFPTGSEGPWCEPLTVLAAAASVTTRVRLGTGILIAGLRPAPVLAKTVATLDVLSAGRVDLGVGVGWQREEYEALGLPFAARGRILNDTIAACRALWERAPASFRSETVSFEEIWCVPHPTQDRVPVWFGGTLNDRVTARVVELGDGWIPIMGATLGEIAEGAARLTRVWSAAGRQGTPEVRIPLTVVRDDRRRADLARTMAQVPAVLEAGATDVHVMFPALVGPGDLDRADEILAEVVGAFEAAR